ncbi:MAG: hypothetical protein WEF50_03180 [Myxococcota bacterium]
MPIRLALIRIFVVALMLPTAASADELVIHLDKAAIVKQAVDGSAVLSAVQPNAIPSGLPSILRLPIAAAADGSITISLQQEDVDRSVVTGGSPTTTRLRVMSPAAGRVTEDASGKVAVEMEATLVFEDLATGTERIFDVVLGGDTEAGATYGANLVMHVEAWRRGDDGERLKERTKSNRSFWGTLTGHFER